jgi:hypothetical protein
LLPLLLLMPPVAEGCLPVDMGLNMALAALPLPPKLLPALLLV